MPRILSAFSGLLVSLLVVAAAGPAMAGAAAITADFDYSMPSRFVVPALPDPTLPSPEATRYFAGPLRPASWHVDLDACTSTGSILSYEWKLDGQPLGMTGACDGMSFEVPDEGTYSVTLTVRDGGGASASVTRDVRVQDWLIFGLGDSYGSGEGVPDVPNSQVQIDAVATAQTALQDAQAAAAQRLAEYTQAQDDLAALIPLLDLAKLRYQQWLAAVAARNDACDNIPPTPVLCAEAQAAATAAAAALLAALTDIGLQALFGTTSVLDAIANLRASAQHVVDLARAALDAALAAVSAATQSLDDAIALLGPRWQSRQCHRSHYSGQVQAAEAIEEADPHTSVTFVHLACSGALITVGLLDSYGGVEPTSGAALPPQVDAAATLSEGREVDAVVVSIGGNDVRFSDIITACIQQTKCFDTPPASDPAAASYIADMCAPLGPLAFLCEQYLSGIDAPADSAETIFLGNGTDCGGRMGDDADDVGLDDLPCNYDALDTEIHTLTAAGDLNGVVTGAGGERVYLTAYPSITRREPAAPGEPTQICGFDPNESAAERRRNLPGISQAEMLWAETFVSAKLAGAMQDSASAHGWHFVDDHASSFDGHGYCADDNWIVRIPQSVDMQGRIDPVDSSYKGGVHPTQVGQEQYATAIAAALRCDFYPDCDPTREPRAPEPTEPTSTTTSTTMPGVPAVCGDATGDSVVAASDALAILRAAVGTGTCTPCRCDVDASGSVTASDALAVLRQAVGLAIDLVCSPC